MGLAEVCSHVLLSGSSVADVSSEAFGLLVWSTGLSANPFVERLEGVSHDDKTKSYVPACHLLHR